MIGLKALTNFRMKVLKMSRSSKLLSVLGTSTMSIQIIIIIIIVVKIHISKHPCNEEVTFCSKDAHQITDIAKAGEVSFSVQGKYASHSSITVFFFGQ